MKTRHIVKVISLTAILSAALGLLALEAPKTEAATISKTATTSASLVGWWKLDEGGSSLAGDSSGLGYTLSLSGSPTWTSGKRGGALQFGSSKYLTTSSMPAVTSSAITMSAWIYPTTYSSYNVILSQRSACGNANFQMHLDVSNGRLSFWGSSFAQTTYAPPLNAWTHVAITYNGGSVVFYANGNQVGTASSVTRDTTQTLFRIGTDGTCNNWFNGKIDDVRVYNQSLSATDILALYRSGEAVRKTTDRTNLAGWWTLDEATSTVVGDFSGNNNSATTTGLPTWVFGKRGKALQFNGSSQYAGGLSSSGLPTGTSAISAFAWIKTTSTSRETAFSYGNSATGQAVSLNVNQLASNGRFVPDFYNANADSGVVVNDGNWHHIGFSLAGNTTAITMYVDGVAYSGTLSNTPNIAAGSSVQIGRWITQGTGDKNSYYFNGSVDDVRVYNRALTSTEVQALYRQNQTLINAPQDTKYTSGLVGYWTFNGKDVGSAIADVSGRGNHTYLSGGFSTSTAFGIGKVGQGLSKDSAAVVPLVTTNTTNVTIAGWFKWDGTNMINGLVNVGNGGANGYGILIGSGSGCTAGNKIDILIAGQTCNTLNSTYVMPTNTWTHIAITSSNNVWSLYVDGAFVSSATKTATTPNATGTMGAPNAWTDEIRIYNRALSASEIKQLYLMGK